MDGTGSPLIAALRSPDAYPHPVVTPIRVAETHISWVLLTGELAYKVKKPLRLSFLDYSTLERRRLCCEEETRLNRRYAPDLYEGVAVVCGTPEAPRVDGTGPVIEYAVRMKQFDPAAELDALLASSLVPPGELAELGRHIARFHEVAAPVDAAESHGLPERVHRVTLDNFTELLRLPESRQWSAQLDALEQWVNDRYAQSHALLRERRKAGRVRECHGDLHCGNVVRWQGTLVPFDGIEFDPALRYVDVVSDLAFLTMDLAARRRPALRHAVLQSWTEASGDCAGLPLLPYFEVYRALVRGKVAALRAQQAPAHGADREGAIRDARRYLDWATTRTQRRPAALMLTCGLSGSGKTRLSRALAAELDALHLRSDVERKRLAGLAPLEDSKSPPDAGIYTPDFNRRTYTRLLECARAGLQGGENVIVDAAFLRRSERMSLLALARDMSAPATILHCQAPDDVLRRRVAARADAKQDASEAGVAVLERQPGYWEEFDALELPHVLGVDTTATDAVQATAARLRSTAAA
ncbi:MAG: AAA family ATPase [Steroidobacteraceae bacterium]